jgi:predicted aldo/keto reductase-like oxidoreductase
MLTQRGIPVWVMEPVRGGKLAKLDEDSEKTLKGFRPDASTASWSFRFLQQLPNVTMILSGMSDIAQVEDNLNTFENENPLSEAEEKTLLDIAEKMKDSIPCTSCRYCTDSCPAGLDIPFLLNVFNEVRVVPSVNSYMRLDVLGPDKQSSACIKCGKCVKMCPQGIDIPGLMEQFTETLAKLPSWESICHQRDESQIKA